MIQVKKAFSFSEIGKKDNQEDRVYPAPETVKAGQRYFILCDGMGGHDNGEVASETVSTSLGHYFDSHPVGIVDESYFTDALGYAYTQLDGKDSGAEKKMGTTLTCLIFNSDSFLAAHIGDSRIYQVRNGEIIFKTRDHSLVNDLIKAGEISEEEAENYPRKNVITRAMQPNTRRCKADVLVSNDVQPGDYFFMCCDGVLERVDDKMLCDILAGQGSDSSKIAQIKAACDQGTKDNYTCWLLPVEAPSASFTKKVEGNKMLLTGAAIVAAACIGFIAGRFTSHHGDPERDTRKEAKLESKADTLENKMNELEQNYTALKAERDSLADKLSAISSIAKK